VKIISFKSPSQNQVEIVGVVIMVVVEVGDLQELQ
jgi:hypothetical protein